MEYDNWESEMIGVALAMAAVHVLVEESMEFGVCH